MLKNKKHLMIGLAIIIVGATILSIGAVIGIIPAVILTRTKSPSLSNSLNNTEAAFVDKENLGKGVLS